MLKKVRWWQVCSSSLLTELAPLISIQPLRTFLHKFSMSSPTVLRFDYNPHPRRHQHRHSRKKRPCWSFPCTHSSILYLYSPPVQRLASPRVEHRIGGGCAIARTRGTMTHREGELRLTLVHPRENLLECGCRMLVKGILYPYSCAYSFHHMRPGHMILTTDAQRGRFGRTGCQVRGHDIHSRGTARHVI